MRWIVQVQGFWRLRLLLARWGILQPGKIMYIGGSDVLPPPLSREEETAYLARLEGEGADREDARAALIEHNLRLVVYIARRFENTGVGIEDLISIGTIGLIKAVGTYNPGKNIKLATYASRCIENEILMYLRKISTRRNEVSFDEPLNTDWDGNELLLSDVLGTEGDMVMKPIEDDVDRRLLLDALELQPCISAGLHLGEGCGAVLALPLLDQALAVYNSGHTFDALGIDAYVPQ